MDKITEWHFPSTSNESIWPKTISDFMKGLMVIFQNGLGWPCPVSPAVKAKAKLERPHFLKVRSNEITV